MYILTLYNYLLQTYFRQKNRKYIMENTHITQRLFPWKPKPGKLTYSIFIHFIHCLQYNLHIGANNIQNPTQWPGLVNNPNCLTKNRKPLKKNMC
jgi:hypothetical protein